MTIPLLWWSPGRSPGLCYTTCNAFKRLQLDMTPITHHPDWIWIIFQVLPSWPGPTVLLNTLQPTGSNTRPSTPYYSPPLCFLCRLPAGGLGQASQPGFLETQMNCVQFSQNEEEGSTVEKKRPWWQCWSIKHDDVFRRLYRRWNHAGAPLLAWFGKTAKAFSTGCTCDGVYLSNQSTWIFPVALDPLAVELLAAIPTRTSGSNFWLIVAESST